MAGRPRRALVGGGSCCPEPRLVPRPVVPAVSSQNGGGLIENMAAYGTFRPGRLWGCSSVPGTVSPRAACPYGLARTARESGRVPSAFEPGEGQLRAVCVTRRAGGGALPTALAAAEVPLPRSCPGAVRAVRGWERRGWADGESS